jgi:hypothetical protein
MATDTPTQGVTRNYCVVLRCITRLYAPRGAWLKLPVVQTDDGPMEFCVMSEFYEIDATHSIPQHLILQTVIPAGNLSEAKVLNMTFHIDHRLSTSENYVIVSFKKRVASDGESIPSSPVSHDPIRVPLTLLTNPDGSHFRLAPFSIPGAGIDSWKIDAFFRERRGLFLL